jgi:hypothetical protein
VHALSFRRQAIRMHSTLYMLASNHMGLEHTTSNERVLARRLISAITS